MDPERPDRRTTESGPPSPGGEPEAGRRAQEEQFRRLRRERGARVAKALVALAISVILIVFVIANSEPVRVNFVFATRHPRLIWVMLACAVLGGVVGYLIGRPGRGARARTGGRRGQPEG
jgi:uncharacterized integral membrane protein